VSCGATTIMDGRAWEQREEERKEGRIFLLLRVLVRDQCSPVVGSSRVESSRVECSAARFRPDQIRSDPGSMGQTGPKGRG